ncbi:hypothetical protein EDEG_03903 [Edhazardia aedis USNM 41457]|uniref:Uncharacterized protein n=1 Tax=Edhazardia aedis (strain USNM 41457) TaxID=1003232 RepID=J9D1S0_EDHAE|nr:hypothetical protein EDEG_03903 [Edhazardia aedis USNM 41457]|eukprot:EJW01524.1 hypothetical protein EDEG_03903 [Edhazardia aedis USNM 41457]
MAHISHSKDNIKKSICLNPFQLRVYICYYFNNPSRIWKITALIFIFFPKRSFRILIFTTNIDYLHKYAPITLKPFEVCSTIISCFFIRFFSAIFFLIAFFFIFHVLFLHCFWLSKIFILIYHK